MRDAENQRWNLVLIVSDDHGREATGCYGNPVVRTPNLDELARDGVRFDNGFCTTASCAASRSVILTGLHNHATGTYGHTHGVHHFSCFPHIRTLPALLREAGYRTGRVGKRHYAPETIFPWDWERPEGEFGRDDVRMSNACREFIRGREPFFLYWCSHNPHRSGEWDDRDPNRPNRFGNPQNSFEGDTEETFSPSSVVVPSFLPDIPAVRSELAQYYQSIARLDRGVGRLLQILKEEGRYDRTVVVYISDNGAAFPQAKTTLYDPGMRLPCLVRAPGMRRRGVAVEAPVSWVDLTPTFLDYAGVRFEERVFHGRSFRAIAQGESAGSDREGVFASHTFHEITNYYPMRIWRDRRYKFIWNIAWKLDYSFASDLWESACWQAALKQGMTHFGMRSVDAYQHRPRFELYDLERDPHEVENLAYRPEYAAMVESFKNKIRRFQEETGDPWRHKWEYE
jgi:N-sulfoglucosamine sulfohydrolase